MDTVIMTHEEDKLNELRGNSTKSKWFPRSRGAVVEEKTAEGSSQHCSHLTAS